MTNLIAKNEEYALYRPFNSWDTNYHLIDLSNNKDYLIDIHDVYDHIEDVEEYGGMLFKDMLILNVDEIIDNAWKIV